MVKRKFIIPFILVLLTSFTIAQNNRVILKPGGEKFQLNKSLDLREAIKVSKFTKYNGRAAKSNFAGYDFTAAGIMDTLTYKDLGIFNTNFGFNGQDVMMQFFEAPADLTIKAMSYSCSDDEGALAGSTVSLRLIKLNWTLADLKDFADATYQGYYPSAGDGFNNSDYFGEEATGNWISKDIDHPLPPWTNTANPGVNTWDYDLWSDGGFGWPTTPELGDGAGDYFNWVETINLGFEPEILKGEVFAVVAVHDGVNLDADRIGLYADETLGYPGWKYYENGRLSYDDQGWWVRMYTWDFAVAVDITGDTPPAISDMTVLGTVLSTAARTVEATIIDENPGGGSAGVATANLMYTVNGGSPQTVAMTAAGDLYSGDIPGQAPGSEITYWIEATDVNGNGSSTVEVTYSIFDIENPNALVVFNGFAGNSGYPQDYYFGATVYPNEVGSGPFTITWDHDVWAFGPLTEELVSSYNNIIEITSDGPADINSSVIRAWLAADGSRNYMLAGDEWLGVQTGWTNTTYAAGDFQYDILGISADYNDVNYASSGDQNLASEVSLVEGSLLGGDLYTAYNQCLTDSGWTSPMLYDPFYEINVVNWLDGVDFLADVEVDMKGIGIDGATYNIGGHRTLAAGNKVVFLSYDPLSLDSAPEYWWWGIMFETPQVQTLDWFGALPGGVEEPYIAVTYPNGGEVWYKGTTKTITWTDNIDENVKIDLYRNTSFIRTIASSSASDGNYTWLIPTDLETASDYNIRITSISNTSVFDFSDNVFTITGTPYITVTYPNGGEELYKGTTQTITWTDNIDENVKIDLYRNSSFIRTITSSSASDGNYTWFIPTDLAIASDYNLRIISISNTSVYDFSDNVFTISGTSYITVTSPNGGEEFEIGTSKTISWSSVGLSMSESTFIERSLPGSGEVEGKKKLINNTNNNLIEITNVKIEYSTNNGSNWIQIVASTSNDGSYSWTIPNTPSSQCKVKISDVADPGVFDESDNTFSITSPGSIITSLDEDFELYTDFVLDFSPWTLVDVDGNTTFGIEDFDFNNEHSPMAYIIFNPLATSPPLTDNWEAHGGNKYAACFGATTPPNNDWLISPQVTPGSSGELKFWARSLTSTYGLERFKVGVSTSGTSPQDFTIISTGSYLEAPTDWTQYTFDLSAYEGDNIYVGINCVSNET